MADPSKAAPPAAKKDDDSKAPELNPPAESAPPPTFTDATSDVPPPTAPSSNTLPETPAEEKLARVSLTDNLDLVDSLPTPPTSANKSVDEKPQSSLDKTTGRGGYVGAANMCELPGDEDASFKGEVTTNNKLPSQDVIDKIGDYIVLDRHGKTHPFKSLYTGKNVARRVLVIFVRHFFCGNCQEYLRTLSAAITPDNLLNLPISTFIAVVGCGAPELIDTYAAQTNCPFPIYTDPTRKLYDELGMVRTLSMGAKPAYIRRSFAHTVVTGVVQGLKQVPKGLATKSGDQKQVGGEFMFEPYTAMTPMEEMPDKYPFGVSRKMSVGFNSLGDGTRKEDVARERNGVEEKRVSWCHRMRTTRDHAELPELMEVLGLDDPDLDGEGMEGLQDVDRKKWSKATGERKGTGLSLASEMSRMSKEMEAVEVGSRKGRGLLGALIVVFLMYVNGTSSLQPYLVEAPGAGSGVGEQLAEGGKQDEGLRDGNENLEEDYAGSEAEKGGAVSEEGQSKDDQSSSQDEDNDGGWVIIGPTTGTLVEEVFTGNNDLATSMPTPTSEEKDVGSTPAVAGGHDISDILGVGHYSSFSPSLSTAVEVGAKETPPASATGTHHQATNGTDSLHTKTNATAISISTNKTIPDVELVIASMKHENTSWVPYFFPSSSSSSSSSPSSSWGTNVYVVDDSNATLTVPLNKGREAMVILTYLIDRYDSLPEVIIFHHAERFQWHIDHPDYDSLALLRTFNTTYTLAAGYVNLRCSWTLGCPVEIRPLAAEEAYLASVEAARKEYTSSPPEAKTKDIYAGAWRELFPGLPVPELVGVGCCSQFAVSREAVLSRPREDYARYREWLMDTELGDALSGRVLEYAWHVIFGAVETASWDGGSSSVGSNGTTEMTIKEAITCPDARECYCRVYGWCDFVETEEGKEECDEHGCAARYALPPFATLPKGWPYKGWEGEDRGWVGEVQYEHGEVLPGEGDWRALEEDEKSENQGEHGEGVGIGAGPGAGNGAAGGSGGEKGQVDEDASVDW
ncbi:Thioredoxin-like protein AAED1 [Zalerion maritima]|uniref:Thioredoxin-like protein AAED1 n=1 Tax=Zalerion maritima TaxID=339359 RepID=A0AAD5WT39_9PEZI|nr:Thioredoxin-like protein AAED1 [Zalerion maritima]